MIMSNDLLNEQFFNNPNIPDCEKLGVISLLGCGSLDQQMDSTGRESSFVSMSMISGTLMFGMHTSDAVICFFP